ncbi:uncharacterized protein LOC130642126 [Hydractinia symbiolongicarpus]|uniref:uncharacterized protein LOC130642126 n=1 Tax=Hydractinia symbiolongicarpus TaxID=13093 RepID=UPI00254C341D|nr:uncharacterized protein LOC130642126 [Hydractinia symbiolongicarpus]
MSYRKDSKICLNLVKNEKCLHYTNTSLKCEKVVEGFRCIMNVGENSLIPGKKTQTICLLRSCDHLKMHLSSIGNKVAFSVMGDVWADNRDVEEAAIKAFQIIYGGNDLTDLCKLRYRKYLDMCWKGKIDPEKMPPTESAAILHGFRVHLQIMNWKILEEEELKQIDPSKWGWKIENSQMMPIKTDKQVAPDSLLKIIKCNCKATSKSPCSTNLCSCRKHGLSCMQSCGECHGETCENKEVRSL